MEFQQLVVVNGLLVIGMLVASAGLFLSIFMFAYLVSTQTYLLKKVMALVGALVATFFTVVMILVSSDYVDGNRIRNGEKFTHNIKAKYEVSEVISVSGSKDLHYVDHLADADELEIVVRTNDNLRFQFLVTVNPETSEPTLIDPPIIGGSATVKNLGADELLKK